MLQCYTSVSRASIQCRTSAVVRICNRDVEGSVTSVVYRRVWFALRRRRWRLILLACALLAAGCAHDRDASSDSEDHPSRHHGHRGGGQSFTSPSPSGG